MSGKSSYLAKKLTDHANGKAAFTMPTGLWLALCSTAPTYAAGGTELTSGGYARVAVTFGAATDGSGKATSANDIALLFGIPTEQWTAATHFETFDAATSGNRLFWGALASTLTALVGVPLAFPIGYFVHTEA